MAIRQTLKRKSAYTTALRILPLPRWKLQSTDNATLYSLLDGYGYFWHADKGCWSRQPALKSQYIDENGNPSGLISLRIQAHPEDAAVVQGMLMGVLVARGYGIEEISDPEPNDNGVGVRIYVKAHLPEKVKARK